MMAITAEEAITRSLLPPPIPREVPKAQGFSFLPAGTKRTHDGGKWGLYYYAPGNVSYIIVDAGQVWSVRPVLGKMRVTMAKGVMATKPCCQED